MKLSPLGWHEDVLVTPEGKYTATMTDNDHVSVLADDGVECKGNRYNVHVHFTLQNGVWVLSEKYITRSDWYRWGFNSPAPKTHEAAIVEHVTEAFNMWIANKSDVLTEVHKAQIRREIEDKTDKLKEVAKQWSDLSAEIEALKKEL